MASLRISSLLGLVIAQLWIVSVEPEAGLRNVCHSPQWIPSLIKRPHMVLLNDANCPSFMTKDIFTKRPIKKDLTVPKGIPLSLFCGMCIRPSVSLVPILANFQGDTPLAQEVVKSGNEIRHKKYGNQCFLTYALTEPLHESGTWRCAAQYGSTGAYEETATWRVQEVPIHTTEEAINVREESVVLRCPNHPDPETAGTDPLIHVWYHPMGTSNKIAAPSNGPKISLKVSSQPLIVSCATYHMFGSSQVVVTTFTVTRSKSYRYQSNNQPPVMDKTPPNSRLPTEGEQIYEGGKVVGTASGSAGDISYSANSQGGGIGTAFTVGLSVAAVVLAVVIGVFAFKFYKNSPAYNRSRE